MPKGIAYFKDGHEEEILYSTVYTREGRTYIEFVTPSGEYMYKEWVLEMPLHMKRLTHGFFKWERRPDMHKDWEPVDIIISITLNIPFPKTTEYYT